MSIVVLTTKTGLSENLHLRKMVLAKKLNQGMLNTFYILSKKKSTFYLSSIKKIGGGPGRRKIVYKCLSI